MQLERIVTKIACAVRMTPTEDRLVRDLIE